MEETERGEEEEKRREKRGREEEKRGEEGGRVEEEESSPGGRFLAVGGRPDRAIVEEIGVYSTEQRTAQVFRFSCILV